MTEERAVYRIAGESVSCRDDHGRRARLINRRLTFVLGAGAHCSYGLPSGEKLKDQCVGAVGNFLINCEYFPKLLQQFKHEPLHRGAWVELCQRFQVALKGAGQASIDAFLNCYRHDQGVQIVGKAAIALSLLQREYSSRRGGDWDKEDHWLQYLFYEMCSGVSSAEEFVEKNNVSFITFNYDHFLEWWLFERLMYSFDRDEEIALQYLQRIPICHVYGTLGKFTPGEIAIDSKVVEAASSLRTIFEQEDDSESLSAAKALLLNADHVCLLGFGFHPENISIIALDQYARSGRPIRYSTFELTAAEQANHTRSLRAIRGSNIQPEGLPEGHKCRATLRRLPLFG